jgi:hypothetical protein
MAGHLQKFATHFRLSVEDDLHLKVVHEDVIIVVTAQHPWNEAKLAVQVRLNTPQTFTLEVLSPPRLELRWGRNVVIGGRLLILAEKLEDSAIPLNETPRALVRLFRQVDGDESYRGSFVRA